MHAIQPDRIHNVRPGRAPDVRRTGSMAFFATDVPLRHCLGLDVVIDRVATVAQRTRGALHIVGGIDSGPPVRTRRRLIGSPHLMRDVPLCWKRKIVIAALREIALLPFAAISERQLYWIGHLQRLRSSTPGFFSDVRSGSRHVDWYRLTSEEKGRRRAGDIARTRSSTQEAFTPLSLT